LTSSYKKGPSKTQKAKKKRERGRKGKEIKKKKKLEKGSVFTFPRRRRGNIVNKRKQRRGMILYLGR